MRQPTEKHAPVVDGDSLRGALSAVFKCDVAVHVVPIGYAFAVPGGTEDQGLYAVRRQDGLWRIEDGGTLVPLLVAEGRLTPGRHGELIAMLAEVELALDYDTLTISGPDVAFRDLGWHASSMIKVLQAACSRFRRTAPAKILLALAERFSEDSGPDHQLDGEAWIALGLFGDLHPAWADEIGKLAAQDPGFALSLAIFGVRPSEPGQPSRIPAFSSSIDAAVVATMRLGLDETSAGEWLERAVASMRSDGCDPVWSTPDGIARALMSLLLKDLAGAGPANQTA